MLETWLVYFLIFVSVFLAAQTLQFAIRGELARKRRTSERFSSLDRSAKVKLEVDVLKKRSSRVRESRLSSATQELLLQSGTSLDGPRLLAVVAVLGLALYFLLPWPTVTIYKVATSVL